MQLFLDSILEIPYSEQNYTPLFLRNDDSKSAAHPDGASIYADTLQNEMSFPRRHFIASQTA
jgi:hypothetical protein